MQFALMICHTPEEFEMRKNDYNHPHLGAWRAYYKALVAAGVYVGGNALELSRAKPGLAGAFDRGIYRSRCATVHGPCISD